MGEEQPKLPEKIAVRYRKATGHPAVHADGATAVITPQLELQIAFFQAMMPLPEGGYHPISPDGFMEEAVLLGQPQPIIEREVNATVIVNPVVAIQLIRSLQELISHIKISANEDVKNAISRVEASKV
jgi:hypothetical protein